MKKTLLMTTAFAAMVIFASCSKNNDEMPIDDGTKAYLSVSVNAPATKTTGIAKPTDNVIDNFTAFVAYADGSLVSGYSSNGANLTVSNSNAIVVSKNLADGNHVYVVANAGDLTAIDELADLVAYIADLDAAGEGKQEATKVWATGKTTTGLSFTQIGNDFIATANVDITFIASRITITIENGMTGYDATNMAGDLVLNSVAVLNARGASLLFGASLIPTPAQISASTFAGTTFYSGIDGTGFTNYPVSGEVTAPVSYLVDNIGAGDFTTVYHYYVFENDAVTAADLPTIVTLIGTFGGGTIYYPVHLAPYEQFFSGSISGSGLERGKSYDINIKLTVDPTNPGGTTDPTDPLITAQVEVVLTINDWEAVILEKVF